MENGESVSFEENNKLSLGHEIYKFSFIIMLLSASVLLLLSSCSTDDDENSDNEYGAWEGYIGEVIGMPALPDYRCNYFAYSFDRGSGGNEYVALRIKGEFAYSRYMSYNIYNTLKATSYGAITDFEMQPLPGNVNPFLPENSFEAVNRQYEVTVAPEGYTADSADNLFIFDSDSIRYLTVILRYYVPQGDVKGNVPIPAIEAFDIQTGQIVDLPERYPFVSTDIAIYKERISPIFKTIIDDSLRFYRNAGGGQFNCADNLYLINAVRMTEDSVLTLKFLSPTFPSDNTEFGSTDVRYWSLNQGNDDTTTPFGVMDSDFTVAEDGFVYIAIGDNSIKDRACELGYNFMPWKVTTAKGVLIYRNMLTNSAYQGSIENVPFLSLIGNPSNVFHQNAKNFIGDYAPTGLKVSKSDFINKTAGTKVPPVSAQFKAKK